MVGTLRTPGTGIAVRVQSMIPQMGIEHAIGSVVQYKMQADSTVANSVFMAGRDQRGMGGQIASTPVSRARALFRSEFTAERCRDKHCQHWQCRCQKCAATREHVSSSKRRTYGDPYYSWNHYSKRLVVGHHSLFSKRRPNRCSGAEDTGESRAGRHTSIRPWALSLGTNSRACAKRPRPATHITAVSYVYVSLAENLCGCYAHHPPFSRGLGALLGFAR